MKIIGYIFAGVLMFLGLIFCVSAASTGLDMRWVLGGILLGSGMILVYFLRMKVPDQQVTITRNVNIDLSGDVKLEKLNCKNCGGALDSKNISLQAGAVFVECPYCSSEYQIEEAPTW